MKKLELKYLLILPTVITLLFQTVYAQSLSPKHKYAEFGLRFMPTFTSLQIKNSSGNHITGDVTLGFGVGALIGFNFNEHVGLQGELIYNSISQRSKVLDTTYKINLRYINIPLLLSLNTGKSKVVNFNIVGGPQIGLNVGSSLTSSGASDVDNPQPILSVKKNDLGFAYGAGIDFSLNPSHTIRFSLGYRGVLGLIDISNTSNSTSTNSYFILDRSHVKTNSAYAGLSILF